MFAADDPTATASMAKTYRALGNRVDYVLVKNPARFRSQAFDETAMAELFKRQHVPIVELPTITNTTLEEIKTASAENKRHLTYVEAAKTLSIPFICRKEIEHFLNRVFVQCEDAASVLTPDTALIQNKVLRVKDRLTRLAIDEFNPLDIHE
jgi:hypothetical protein